MSGPLTEEKKARIVADEINKKANKRYAAFAKYHVEAFEFRDFLVAAIRGRIASGGNYPDGPLEMMVVAEKQRRKLAKKAESQIRTEQGTTDPMYSGMAIGLMIAGEPRADLRGLIVGLAGIQDEEVEAQPATIIAGQENDSGKTQ